MISVSVSVIKVVAIPNFPARPVRPAEGNEISLNVYVHVYVCTIMALQHVNSNDCMYGYIRNVYLQTIPWTACRSITYSVAVIGDLVGAVEVEHI